MDTRKKIVKAKDFQSGGERWAAAAGRFEVLTAEHCAALERLKAQVDRLAVLLAPDADGPFLVEEAARAQLAAAPAAVDAVIVCSQADRPALIERLRPLALVEIEAQIGRNVVADVLERHEAVS